tara:strand:- start:135 stop:551 length:417 start_codon:yes stop_codon:yes gene_type:complete
MKKYNEKNKEKQTEYFKIYHKNNLDKKLKIQKQRKLTEPLYKLRCNISSLIRISIRRNGYSKKSKTYEYLGCSFEYFKVYLEKQFTEGMTWQNAGEWHLDHIYPVSLAKDEEELIKLNHYSNFQPLWAIDNIIKGNKI